MKPKQQRQYLDQSRRGRSAVLSDGGPTVRSQGETSGETTLVFHKSVSRFSYSVTNFSPRRIFGLLDQLHRAGFSFGGRHSVPHAHSLVVSFDDGYGHLMDLLPSLIDQFDIRPHVFMPTELIGKSNKWDYSHLLFPCKHLNREEIRRLDEWGVEFGSHGHRHVDLRSLDDRQLFAELRHSKGILEDLLGKTVTRLSYPFGRTDARVARIAHSVGFTRGYTMKFPTGSDSHLSTGRIPIYGYDTSLSVRMKLSHGPWRQVEALKVAITNYLSGGTILLNTLRRQS
ncbi:MAG: polysaccharide deacetylase family protein [Candidatus Zixiibacteriota bacterium]